MLINIYSVFDITAELYGAPFLLMNDSLAQRSIAEAARNPNTEISKYPGEYVLYHIGAYDDETAMLEAAPAPRRICSAQHAKRIYKAETMASQSGTEEPGESEESTTSENT